MRRPIGAALSNDPLATLLFLIVSVSFSLALRVEDKRKSVFDDILSYRRSFSVG